MKDLSNDTMIHIKKGNIEYLQFRKLLEYKFQPKKGANYEATRGLLRGLSGKESNEEIQVQSLMQEDPTYSGATMDQNCGTCAPCSRCATTTEAGAP